MALVFANVPFKLKLMWKSARSPCTVYVTSYQINSVSNAITTMVHPALTQQHCHPQHTGKHQPNGGYLLHLPYSDHRELIMDILKQGVHFEVLGPVSLRRAIGTEP